MLFGSELPKRYYGEAIQIANYLQNKTPSKALSKNTTPFEERFGIPPQHWNTKSCGNINQPTHPINNQ